MAIRTHISEDNGKSILTISITGRFDISSYKDFTQAYKDRPESLSKIVLDMAEVEYMDSSALGMILMLRERAGGEKSFISMVNCGPGIIRTLKTANFDKLFHVE